MAKINRQALPRTNAFTTLQAEANAVQETNDCAVKAVALVCGVSYEVAHAACAAEGRKPGKGMGTDHILRVVAKLGKRPTQVNVGQRFIENYPAAHKILRSVTTHHPDRFNKVWADGKTYLMFVSGHVLAIINGVNHDWSRGKARRAIFVYEVA
jgi:hypothetical protein